MQVKISGFVGTKYTVFAKTNFHFISVVVQKLCFIILTIRA